MHRTWAPLCGQISARSGSAVHSGEFGEVCRGQVDLGRYSAAHPSAVLDEVYRREPDLAAARPPFGYTLHRLLAATAAGLPKLC